MGTEGKRLPNKRENVLTTYRHITERFKLPVSGLHAAKQPRESAPRGNTASRECEHREKSQECEHREKLRECEQ